MQIAADLPIVRGSRPSMILAKAFPLTNDRAIKDQSIVAQIRAR
jgi:hypothetical protein